MTKPKLKNWYLVKELAMGILAIASIIVVLIDLFHHPSASERRLLDRVDVAIAIIFLIDFAFELLSVQDRSKFIRHNWYFLLAAIPVTESIAESLRIVRVVRLVRIVRASEHIDFNFKQDS